MLLTLIINSFTQQVKVTTLKKLSLGSQAKEGEEISLPKILSQWLPIKSIYLGLVARSIPRRAFDVRIFIEWVTNQVTVSILTAN